MAIFRTITAPVRSVTDILFPPTCWVDRAALEAPRGLSEDVRVRIAQLAAQEYCTRCGLTTGPFAMNDKKNPRGRCAERLAGISRTARVGTFSEPLIALVHRLKFARSWEVAGVLAPFLYQAILRVSEQTETPVDYLVPVPLHWRRRAWRGFNQAEELARETGRLSGWRVRKPLKRVRMTGAQAKIAEPTVRAENVKGAFVCRMDGTLAKKHVWLVDDVTTTGATLHAAALAIRKLPREMQPASINAAVICVTDHGAPPAA